MSASASTARLPGANASPAALLTRLRDVVGSGHVLTGAQKTRRYSRGYRFGDGPVLAVVRPGTLLELWDVANACVEADKIIIMQAANTGLTGGSTPDGDDYDRQIVIISTLRMNRIRVIAGGAQVICWPGATLDHLERELAPLGRDPHSVIGSSCIGASVLGGVCNNSGGALVQRGPAYTELALFARLDETGGLQLVNHLGVHLGSDPRVILDGLDQGWFDEDAIAHDSDRVASDPDYAETVRDVAADTPARFNADTRRHFEASGSAGRLIVFAVRLDTFPKPEATATFYIGTNDPARLNALRRDILQGFKFLPVSGEYLHREAFDIAERYGKDTFLAILLLGTRRLPLLFGAKAGFDALAERLGLGRLNLSDRILQGLSRLAPPHLPPRMKAFRERFEHHLILTMNGPGIDEARAYLKAWSGPDSDAFECAPREAQKAALHRFAAAGAAVRYRAIHTRTVQDIVALDIALPRNEQDWFERLPETLSQSLVGKLYYGHFFCMVFHQDYIVAKGADPMALEHAMWKILDARRAEYPAEHNVGHLYVAKPGLVDFYRKLDPTNGLNPGLGHTSKHRHWC